MKLALVSTVVTRYDVFAVVPPASKLTKSPFANPSVSVVVHKLAVISVTVITFPVSEANVTSYPPLKP